MSLMLKSATLTLLCLAIGTQSLALPDYFGRGKSYYDEKRWSLAASFFRKTLDQNDRDSLAHYYLANAYANMGKHEKAIPEYKRVVKLDAESYVGKWSAEALRAYGKKAHEVPAITSEKESQLQKLGNERREAEELKRIHAQAGEAKAKILMDGAQKQAAKVRSDANEALNDLPRRGLIRRMVEDLFKQEAEDKAKKILSDGQKRATNAASEAQKRVQGVDQTTAGLDSQLTKKEKGDFGLKSKGTSIYVRQYGDQE